MKWNLLVHVLIVGLCYEARGDGEELLKEDYDDKRIIAPFVKKEYEEPIYNPCDLEKDDKDCIKHFFVSNGHCTPQHGPHRGYDDESPVYRDRQILYLPHFGMTILLTDSKISRLNGKIVNFYVNKKTSNLVMAVDLKDVTVESKLGYFQYHQKGKEPVITKDRTKVTYTTTLTAVIPLRPEISLKEARVTAFAPVCKDAEIGPAARESDDESVGRLHDVLVADLPTSCEEALLTEAPSLFFAYLQKHICDFGISISS